MTPMLRLLLIALCIGWGLGTLGSTAGAVLQPFGLIALAILAAGGGIAVYFWRRARP